MEITEQVLLLLELEVQWDSRESKQVRQIIIVLVIARKERLV